MPSSRLSAFSALALAAVLVAGAPVGLNAAAPPPGNARPPARLASPSRLDGPAVVRIHDVRPERLAALARRLDLWEVRATDGYAVALLSPADFASLRSEGVALQVDLDRTQEYLSPPGYPCYSDTGALLGRMEAIAAAHPGIAEVVTIGESHLGESLRLLRLTNRSLPGPKPLFYLMAAIHAREMSTSEVAMAFAEEIASGYDLDPDATWLLDHHEIQVLAVANPDGRRLADTGLYQRKNLNDGNGGACSVPPTAGNQYGTDLNRNFSFDWACCGGSSALPCVQTYRGPQPASEPETQAIQGWLAAAFPDRRPADRVSPASLDTAGIAVSLHSYGRLLLWPWGDSYAAAPNSADLSRIGGKLASFNGHVAQQGSGLYITDGITDDWLYGELGVAAFTFEMGDAFFESCTALPVIVQENLAALRYAARIARAPYLLARGPDAGAATLSSGGIERGTAVTLGAILDETANGGDAIASARYYVDLAPWQGGLPLPMTPDDGAFDGPVESVSATVQTAALLEGRHTLFIEGVDGAGHAGAVHAIFLHVYPGAGVPVGEVTAAGSGAPDGVTLSWDPVPGALSYRVAAGSLSAIYNHALIACGAQTPQVELGTIPDDSYLLVEAVFPGSYAGGFGADSSGARRPPATGTCP